MENVWRLATPETGHEKSLSVNHVARGTSTHLTTLDDSSIWLTLRDSGDGSEESCRKDIL